MKIEELAIFKGNPAFSKPRSTSNLIKPNIDIFKSYIKKSFKNGKLNDGLLINTFEKKLAKLHGTKYCVAVVNGLWGLVLTINCLKKENKKQIIMPSLTYRRMADIAAWLKLTPNFCDVNIKTLGITAETAEKNINNEKTVAKIIPKRRIERDIRFNSL